MDDEGTPVCGGEARMVAAGVGDGEAGSLGGVMGT